MWMVLAYVGVGLLGSATMVATAVLVRNRRRRRAIYRQTRRGAGKVMLAAANKQHVRNRKKQANRAGWKAGLREAFPWLVAAARAGSQAFRDAKGDVLHPNQRVRTAGHAKSDKPGPHTKTTPKPGPSPAGPKAIERHSVVLNGKPGPGTGGGTGHLCGAPLKADKKRSCHQPVECPNHGPKCDLELRCHWHGGRTAKPSHGRFGGKGAGR